MIAPQQQQRIPGANPTVDALQDNIEWTERRLKQMHAASTRADRAYHEYIEAETEILATLDSGGYTPAQRDAALKVNRRLNDLQGQWQFWSRESNRQAQAIIAEEAGHRWLVKLRAMQRGSPP